MKRIGILLILAFISWHSVADLEVVYPNRITFAELQLTPEKFIGKHVDMIGILSVQGDKVFLCESMDVCLSWSPFRLQIDLVSLKTATLDHFQIYDTCPVIVIAEFHHEPYHRFNIIGELRSEHMQVGMSISRPDYQDFNKNCVIWNQFMEGFEKRYGDKKDGKIMELIQSMKARTW
jgi:hypothetical protein